MDTPARRATSLRVAVRAPLSLGIGTSLRDGNVIDMRS